MTSDLPTPLPPEAIEPRSFAIIDAEAPQPRPFSGHAWEIARRLVHTSADFGLLDVLRFTPDAVEAGIKALQQGCIILTDTQMARMGMPERRLRPLGCSAVCLINDPVTAELAATKGCTRTAAAVDVAVDGQSDALPHGVGGAIVAIGNAPTALIRLLDRIDQGATPPALIIGMPVGFVLASEAKLCLLERPHLQSISLQGRKGGSALAAATINALAEIAAR